MQRSQFLTLGATVVASAMVPWKIKSYNNVPALEDIDFPIDLTPLPVNKGGRWFMDSPTRIGWFTLRFSDAKKDPISFVKKIEDARINLICLTVGGSFAFYPSEIPFHEWAPGISKNHDFFGQLVQQANARNIRIGARFDFSKQAAKSVEAHPEWFFTKADGTHPVDKSGRTPPCINGDFFRKQAVDIMKEVILKYRPALVYFNNFGNNLGGQGLPDPCQCDNCKKAFLDKTGKSLPKHMTPEVKLFLKESTYETGKLFYDAVQELAPETILINADTNPTQGWHSEGRMMIAPSPVWLYTTSEAVNRQRTSFPESVTCNNITSYSSNASRLVLMPAQETRLRLHQAIAHGSPPTYVATGTLDQDDVRDVQAAISVFKWHAKNEDLFGNTVNPARVLILTQPEVAPRGRNIITQQALKGIYRILAEHHIPVVVSEMTSILESGSFDAVIITPGALHNGLEKYVKQGGNVIHIGEEPQFGIPEPIRTHTLTDVAYVEVRDRFKFPSLEGIKYLLATSPCPYTVYDIFSKTEVKNMEFIEYPEQNNPSLTFVPPMIENPAEVSQSDLKKTNIPALLTSTYGKGNISYLPWNLGALYDRLAIPSHAQLLTDLLDQVLPNGRQIITDAHSSIEMVLSYKKDTNKTILHLINTSGQTQNNYMDAVKMKPFRISMLGKFNRAEARVLNKDLNTEVKDNRTEIYIPEMDEHEVIVLHA